jgi:hypothetical protein
MWDEIQDMPGEIFDISDETRDEMAEAWADDADEEPGWDLYGYDEDQALESYSLECAFGPEE